jgi:hypothetical protein
LRCCGELSAVVRTRGGNGAVEKGVQRRLSNGGVWEAKRQVQHSKILCVKIHRLTQSKKGEMEIREDGGRVVRVGSRVVEGKTIFGVLGNIIFQCTW